MNGINWPPQLFSAYIQYLNKNLKSTFKCNADSKKTLQTFKMELEDLAAMIIFAPKDYYELLMNAQQFYEKDDFQSMKQFAFQQYNSVTSFALKTARSSKRTVRMFFGENNLFLDRARVSVI